MDLDDIRDQARQFLADELPADGLLHALDQWRTAQWPDGTVDLDRQRRCGFPEVIYAEGKTIDDICAAIGRLEEADLPVLTTRISSEQAHVVRARFPKLTHNPTARTLRGPDPTPCTTSHVSVVTGGASDRKVAEEALETLRWMGVPCTLVTDVGVAGPQRLLAHLPQLRESVAVVAIAGMEGALPSAVGGHLACPVVAVPTSIGYGASLGGIAALLAMLNSCAANVTVVNIDAGFKGGYIAGLIASQNTLRDSASNDTAPNDADR